MRKVYACYFKSHTIFLKENYVVADLISGDFLTQYQGV